MQETVQVWSVAIRQINDMISTVSEMTELISAAVSLLAQLQACK